jgi:hypothetical protein
MISPVKGLRLKIFSEDLRKKTNRLFFAKADPISEREPIQSKGTCNILVRNPFFFSLHIALLESLYGL